MKQIKTILLTAVTVISSVLVYGQARNASVMIDKENRNAVMININQPEKITTDALQQRLERSGLKERAKNGIVRYKGVILSEISPDKVDIYTKVESAANNTSVVYMAVSKGYDNFTNSMADSSITQNVKTFLESLVKDADDHFSDVGITNQATDISKDEKSYKQLLDEQSDLQVKKLKIDNRLLQIRDELNQKRESIDKKKLDMEGAKLKRGTPKSQ